MKRWVSSAWYSGLFLIPLSDSAGDMLLVALKIPPSRTGTYSNFTPVRRSIAGSASSARYAFGLPKSNWNSTFRGLTTGFSLAARAIVSGAGGDDQQPRLG